TPTPEVGNTPPPRDKRRCTALATDRLPCSRSSAGRVGEKLLDAGDIDVDRSADRRLQWDEGIRGRFIHHNRPLVVPVRGWVVRETFRRGIASPSTGALRSWFPLSIWRDGRNAVGRAPRRQRSVTVTELITASS